MSTTGAEANHFLTLCDLVGELARRRYQAAERCFSALGLNHTEARLLTLLHHQAGSASQDALSAGLPVDRSNAGRALERLERDGHIVRTKDGDDKRAKRVRLTPKGRRMVVEVAKLQTKMAMGFFGELTLVEAAAVVALLKKALP